LHFLITSQPTNPLLLCRDRLGGAIYASNNANGPVRITVNTTAFMDNRGSTEGGGAIYAGSLNSGSFLDLEEVYFYNNTGIGGASDDVYTTLADFTCFTEAGSSTVVTGGTSASCTAGTYAPTMMPTSAPTTVGSSTERISLSRRLFAFVW
jgi:predicted outer membrane repeat protein